jgi:hypothetical protein
MNAYLALQIHTTPCPITSFVRNRHFQKRMDKIYFYNPLMRKQILYLLTCLVLVSCSKSDADETQPAELFCYPAQVTTHTTFSNGNKESLQSRYTYNKRGELIAIKFYSEGSLIQEYTYEYNSNGQLIRENTVMAEGGLVDYITYEHDADGKVKSTSIYLYDAQNQKSTFYRKYDWFYTSPSQLSEMYTYSEVDGKLRQDLRNVYTYENGLMTRVHTYNMNNTLIRETTLSYDDKPNMPVGPESRRLQKVGEGFPHTRNVVKKEVKDMVQGEVMASFSFESELTYDEKGYRTRTVAHYGDGVIRESHLMYTCP